MRYLWIVLLLVSASPVFAIREVSRSTQEEVEGLTWPLPMPTDEQVDEARNCEFAIDDVDDFEPETACDWIALAVARTANVGDGEALPEEALEAYVQAVSMNPAVALHIEVIIAFWGRLEDTIPAPDIANQPIEEVEISYEFGESDYAGTASYEITISLDDGEYLVNGDSFEMTLDGDENENELEDEELDAELIEALATGLTDLVPIGHTFTDQPCWHIISDWEVNISFEDGSEISMRTYESNVLAAGGPWQTTIDGQSYMQVSPAFLLAVIDIHEELEMPWGEVASYGCGDAIGPLEAGF